MRGGYLSVYNPSYENEYREERYVGLLMLFDSEADASANIQKNNVFDPVSMTTNIVKQHRYMCVFVLIV